MRITPMTIKACMNGDVKLKAKNPSNHSTINTSPMINNNLPIILHFKCEYFLLFNIRAKLHPITAKTFTQLSEKVTSFALYSVVRG